MRAVPAALQTRLDDGVTTLCWCWRLERSDGLVLGITDHDRALNFADLRYGPGALVQPEAEAETGLTTGQGTLAGLIDSEGITIADLEAGLWADAHVTVFRVDWSDPALRVQTAIGRIGEIRRRGQGFEADWLGPADRLERLVGRVFSRKCDAELGDERCGVSASHPQLASGCDKRFATCRDRFANAEQFRGFPYLVGNDVLQRSAASEPVRDGGSRGLA